MMNFMKQNSIKAFLIITLLGISQSAFSQSRSELSFDDSVLQVIAYQTSQSRGLKSRSEVVSEVKQRYGGEVLKVVLDEKKAVYRVRILMPDGRVRVVSVNAVP